MASRVPTGADGVAGGAPFSSFSRTSGFGSATTAFSGESLGLAERVADTAAATFDTSVEFAGVGRACRVKYPVRRCNISVRNKSRATITNHGVSDTRRKWTGRAFQIFASSILSSPPVA